MIISKIYIVETLDAILYELSPIVDLFEQKRRDAPNELLTWIKKAEDQLLQLKMSQSAKLAGVRAQILSASQQGDRRKKHHNISQVSLLLIDDIRAALDEARHNHFQKLEQGRDIANQLLQIIVQSGAVKSKKNNDTMHFAELIWQTCSTHDQLKPIAANLRSILSRQDIICLLAEEIDPLQFLEG